MDNLLAYIPVATLMVVIPGADTMLLMKNTLSYGPKAGRFTVLGMLSGLSFWTGIAILGLSVVIAKSVVLFTTIKYLGAAYLIYLGIKSLITKQTLAVDQMERSADVPIDRRYHKKSFMQAMLSNVLNPKTVIVYITIMPQFINLNGHVNQQLIILASILTGLAAAWFLILVYVVDYAKKWLNDKKHQQMFQRIAGVLLVGFGIKTGI
ncbi:homoserine/threonine efflux transporter [Rossellomorea marisflavi]|jgi:RhtB (resistance to homoserine/threonine) family protein|uniref:homoserine/threonine efflux transporter n=1 Tax=Rossellomorea marisflavi TaxID=189381 RepID=UPI0028535623|nr:homoserine/threonine efflux transporter [Rossellomorea marisflavi]MDR4938154.1 homoserine/threonine efflux transporter [Rossellomorea marisflavi]